MLVHNKIEEIITPTLNSMGLSCVRVLIIDSKRAQTVQIMIERIDGKNVGSDDCQKASQEISVLLDVEGIFTDKYFLEVSSPGVSRPLVKLSDYTKFIGRDVVIKTRLPIIGDAKSYKGKIISVVNDIITIEQSLSKEFVEIDFNLIEKANLVFVHDEFRKILKNRKREKSENERN